MIRRFVRTPLAPTVDQYRSEVPSLGRVQGGYRPRSAGQSAAQAHVSRVSVVTVVRNGEATIENTILSVLSQRHPNLEYIVVDGGSTDGTLDILRRYDDRLALWISEPDRGISDAFNKGIALATGDVIGLLNADDTYTPGAVEACVATLRQEVSAGFSFGHCQYMEGNRPAFLIRGDPEYARIICRRLPALIQPTVFVRRSVGSSRVDLQACKLEYSIVSPK